MTPSPKLRNPNNQQPSPKRFPLLGAHMSIAGGLHRALERGSSIGCNAVQLFTRNSNRWAANPLKEQDILPFLETRNTCGIQTAFAHCSYLINLAGRGDFYLRSIELLTQEVERAELLNLDFVVVHAGAHLGEGEPIAMSRIADALHKVLDATFRARCKIAIENTAGQGSCIGCSMEQLAQILEPFRKEKRIGVCIDTCHLFAAGYDIRTSATYRTTFDSFARLIPVDRVFAFHLNDSKKPLGSRVDRHEHIGKGEIGSEAFRCLLTDPRFAGIPMVLETPKGKELKEDVMNLKHLRKLIR